MEEEQSFNESYFQSVDSFDGVKEAEIHDSEYVTNESNQNNINLPNITQSPLKEE